MLLTLLNDLLDFSKIEAGKLQLERVDFSLPDVMRAAVELVLPAATGKGLLVTVNINPLLPERFNGDASRLRQVLINLASNAVKFTEQGRVTLTVTRSSRGVRFEVTDTGIGIPREVQNRLFQSFTQADASYTTRRYGGHRPGAGHFATAGGTDGWNHRPHQ